MKKKVKLPTLKEIDQLSIDQCASNLDVLAAKLKRWRDLEQALIIRRDNLVSQHTTQEGGWFQHRRERSMFGRIWKRGQRYNCGDYYFLITLRHQEVDFTHCVLKLLNSSEEPLFVKIQEIGRVYQLREESEPIIKPSKRDRSFCQEWEEVSPLSLITLLGAEPVELMRDCWDYLIVDIPQKYNMEVTKYNGKWYEVVAGVRV